MTANGNRKHKIQHLTIAMLTSFVLLFIATSCGPMYVTKVVPTFSDKSNKYFTAKITLFSEYSKPKGFDLTIINHTQKDLELIWDKTLYVCGGRTEGGFMFNGVVYKDRNNPKPPDIIFAGGTFSKRIAPNVLVDFVSGRYGGWIHRDLPLGENGVYLTVKADGEEIHER